MSEQAPTRIYEKDREVFERLSSMPMQILLKAPVSMLPLAVRAAAYCKKRNIVTIGQLASLKKSDLLRARNMGRKTVDHVVAYLNALGLGLDGRLSATVPPALPHPFTQGAKAMRLAVMAQLASMDVPFDVAQVVANIPLPTPEES